MQQIIQHLVYYLSYYCNKCKQAKGSFRAKCYLCHFHRWN